jgi:16S rRNA (guanine527-N7)-methyltransferase
METLDAALDDLKLPRALGLILNDFISLFYKWNQRINLSAARNETEITAHVHDSLHVIPHVRSAGLRGGPDADTTPIHVLDVGAGGGLPGAVVAICLPNVHVTSLEPVHKKHAFLRTVVRELSLSNFEPVAERLEHHARRDYDAAMSRATFDLRDWLHHGLSCVRPGGVVLGFEAVPRADLPGETARHPYHLASKSRAIVELRRPAA